MRSGSLTQLAFSLRQADVDADLAIRGSRQQELQCNRRFARAGTALEQVQPIASQSASKYVVETGDTGACARQKLVHRIHRDRPGHCPLNWKLREPDGSRIAAFNNVQYPITRKTCSSSRRTRIFLSIQQFNGIGGPLE